MTDDRDKVVRGKIVHVHASLEKGAHISIRMDPPSTALILGDDVIAFRADSQRYRFVDLQEATIIDNRVYLRKAEMEESVGCGRCGKPTRCISWEYNAVLCPACERITDSEYNLAVADGDPNVRVVDVETLEAIRDSAFDVQGTILHGRLTNAHEILDELLTAQPTAEEKP